MVLGLGQPNVMAEPLSETTSQCLFTPNTLISVWFVSTNFWLCPDPDQEVLQSACFFPGASGPLAKARGRDKRGRMDKIIIRGGRTLSGTIPISGAKNAALTLMPCALLTDEPLTLRNLPRLADVDSFGHLLHQLGVFTPVWGA